MLAMLILVCRETSSGLPKGNFATRDGLAQSSCRTEVTIWSLPGNEAQRSSDAHIALHKKLQDVADYLLPGNEELVKSTIWHWEVHAPNVFVDRDKITSLIDWQDAWAGPLFLQAQQPRLVDYNGKSC